MVMASSIRQVSPGRLALALLITSLVSLQSPPTLVLGMAVETRNLQIAFLIRGEYADVIFAQQHVFLLPCL